MRSYTAEGVTLNHVSVPAPDPAAIGRRMFLARKEAGYKTAQQLGDAISVSERSVQNYENGVTIPWDHLDKLELALGRSRRWLIWGVSDEPADDRMRQIEATLYRFQAKLDQIEAAVEQQPPDSDPPESP